MEVIEFNKHNEYIMSSMLCVIAGDMVISNFHFGEIVFKKLRMKNA